MRDSATIQSFDDRQFLFHDGDLSFAFDRDYVEVGDAEGTARLEVAIPRLAAIPEFVARLRHIRSASTARTSVDHIVQVLGRFASNWLDPRDPHRTVAEKMLPAVTGLSRPMIAELIRTTFSELTTDKIESLLREELGSARVLDAFQQNGSGRFRRANGPQLLLNIFGGGNPFLPAIDLTLGLLVKAAFIGRVSRREPLVAPLLASSLAEIDPDLAATVVICYWPTDQSDITEALIAEVDCVVASGDDATIRATAEKSRGVGRQVLHGTAFGSVLLARESLNPDEIDELARQVAYDVALCDQRTCLSPHTVYIEEGGALSSSQFAQRLARQLDELEHTLPSGRPCLADSASVARFRAACDFSPTTVDVLRPASGSQARWLVVVDRSLSPTPGPAHRCVRVCLVPTLDDALDALVPQHGALSVVAVAASDRRRCAIAETLSARGIGRICRPGQMLTMPLSAPHEGRLRLGPLLSWTQLD